MQPDQDEKFALNCEFGNYFIFSPTADPAVRAVLQVSCAAVDCGSARPLNTYRLDDGFEVSTGFRSPRKPMYRRPERAARGRLFRFPR